MSIYSANSFNYPSQSSALQSMQSPRKTNQPETAGTTEDENAHKEGLVPSRLQQPPPHEGANWLGYTAIAGGTGLVGGGIGSIYKRNLAFSDVKLQAGWEKLHKAGDTRLRLKVDKNLEISKALNSTDIVLEGGGGTWVKPQDSQAFSYNLQEDGNHKVAGAFVPADRPDAKLKTHSFYLDKETGMGFVGGNKTTIKDPNAVTKANHIAFRPKGGTLTEGWMEKMGTLWVNLTNEHSSLDEVKEAFEKAGYEILEKQKMPTMNGRPEMFKYSSWDDVAKAAVKNKEDWWKLVPEKGMGKFIGCGIAIGIAVAAAGIGLYQALKPKPKPIDKRFDTNS